MGTPLKQNKGASPKGMGAGPMKGLPGPAKPGKGTAAVKFEGTIASSDGVAGITRPAKGTAGSHDGSRTRTHGGG